jgi:hypothetical protein
MLDMIIAADYIASYFPTARVKAMPVSGFFLNVINLDGDYVYGTQIGRMYSFTSISHFLLVRWCAVRVHS